MLYKYLRPVRVDVLNKLEIRFTQPNALNDPFELRPRFESLIREAEVLASYSATPVDFDPILRQAYSMIPEESRSLLLIERFAQRCCRVLVQIIYGNGSRQVGGGCGVVVFSSV